nr:phage tail tape measure protein [Clostridium botulinum]
MSRELKNVSSSYNLANTNAKLFGNTSDVLKSKQAELTSKLRIQNNMVETQSKHITKLNSDIDRQKNKQNELANKIEKTKKAYDSSVKATGKNSEESKRLKKELSSLKEEYAKNDKAIEGTNKKLDNATLKMNKTKKGILENQKALENTNKALKDVKIDKFTDALDKAGNKAGKASDKMKPVSAGIIGLGTVASKSAMDFEEHMGDVDTLLDDHSHLEGYKNKVKEVSNDTGISIDIVSKGMYQAVSSLGDNAKDTQDIFKTMADSAKAGGAEVSDAVSLISAGMKGYGSVSNKTAKQISDLGFQTAKLGVTTFPEMAKSMQPLFSLSSGLNMKITDLFGSMATLTGVTGNTAEVSTQLKAVFSNLMRPTAQMQKVIEKYGYSNAQAMIKSEGLGGVLKIVQKETNGQSDKMAKLFSSTEATTAMTALCGKNFREFTSKTKEMNDAIGATDRALAKVSATTKNKFKTAINSSKIAMVSLGEILLPVVTKVTGGITKIVNAFNKLSKGQKEAILKFSALFVGINVGLGVFSKLSKGISSNIRFLRKFGSVTRNIGKAIKGLNGEVIKNTSVVIKNGAKWVINTGKLIAHKTAQIAVTGATKAMTLAQKALNLVLSMNPIAMVITLLISLGVVFVTLYKKCDWFRDGVNKVWGKIKNIFKGFAKFFKGSFSKDWTQTLGLLGVPLNAFFSVIKSIWSGIKGVFSGIITFLKGVFTGNWRQAFQGLRDIVKNIFGTLGGIIKAPINAAVSGINWVIRKVNGLSFDVPSWVPGVGGKHFGVNLPQIPKLEEGGIVTQATLALVGEGQEHEAVIPLSKLDKLVTESVRKVMRSNSNNVDLEKVVDRIVTKLIYALSNISNITNINLDSRTIARVIARPISEELSRLNKG